LACAGGGPEPFAGKKIELIDPFDWTTAPAGSWDIYYGDIVLSSTDGSFIPIYNRSMMALALASNPTVSGFSAVTEKVPDSTPMTTTIHYHSDQIGSTRWLTSGTGWPTAANTYYPYGAGPMAGDNHYLFTGKERDAESSLDYFGARYYSPTMGRFMTADPLGRLAADAATPQSWNLYSYGVNNPLSNIDPTGLSCITLDKGTPADNGDGQGCAGAGVQQSDNAGNPVFDRSKPDSVYVNDLCKCC
jgi:RHS repeat-associated protein